MEIKSSTLIHILLTAFRLIFCNLHRLKILDAENNFEVFKVYFSQASLVLFIAKTRMCFCIPKKNQNFV